MLRLQTRVAELMRAPIVGVEAHTPVSTVLTIALENDVHFFAVQGQGGIIGKCCPCDLRDTHPDRPISEPMRPLQLTLVPDTPLLESLRDMSEGIDWTVVVDGMSLVGVITWQDLLRGLPGEHRDRYSYSCDACGIDHRLQEGPNAQLLCLDCIDRARTDDWFDLGAAG